MLYFIHYTYHIVTGRQLNILNDSFPLEFFSATTTFNILNIGGNSKLAKHIVQL
jgi:hypothetical protein